MDYITKSILGEKMDYPKVRMGLGDVAPSFQRAYIMSITAIHDETELLRIIKLLCDMELPNIAVELFRNLVNGGFTGSGKFTPDLLQYKITACDLILAPEELLPSDIGENIAILYFIVEHQVPEEKGEKYVYTCTALLCDKSEGNHFARSCTEEEYNVVMKHYKQIRLSTEKTASITLPPRTIRPVPRRRFLPPHRMKPTHEPHES